MLKIIITIIFVYILIRLIIRLIFLIFGIFLTRSLKTKYQNTARRKQNRREQDCSDVIDADFKEVKLNEPDSRGF